MKYALHLESCLDTMASMESGSIDLVVTDPAYKVISGGHNNNGEGKGRKGNSPSGILTKNDGKIFEFNDINPKEYMSELFRVLKDPSHAYIMSNFHALEETMYEIRQAGYEYQTLLVWVKNNATPNKYGMKNIEYCVLARKGKAFSFNDCSTKTASFHKNPSSPKRHETEKPVSLMEEYVGNSSQDGDLIYDPFTGSGATGIACLNLGRRFVGSEIDPSHHANTIKRFKSWEPLGLQGLF